MAAVPQKSGTARVTVCSSGATEGRRATPFPRSSGGADADPGRYGNPFRYTFLSQRWRSRRRGLPGFGQDLSSHLTPSGTSLRRSLKISKLFIMRFSPSALSRYYGPTRSRAWIPLYGSASHILSRPFPGWITAAARPKSQVGVLPMRTSSFPAMGFAANHDAREDSEDLSQVRSVPSDPALPKPASALEPVGPNRPRKRILFVDDEQSVLMVLQAFMQRLSREW